MRLLSTARNGCCLVPLAALLLTCALPIIASAQVQDPSLPFAASSESSVLLTAIPAAPASALAQSGGTNRRGNVWLTSRLGFVVGGLAGAGWGLKKTLSDDESPAVIAGYGALGAFAGLGVGAIVGAVWPSRTNAPNARQVDVQPLITRHTKGVRVALQF